MPCLNRKNLIITLAILIAAACATILIQMQTANADEITLNGRTEQAECHYEQDATDPDMGITAITELCVSESFLCRITDGNVACEIKRDLQ